VTELVYAVLAIVAVVYGTSGLAKLRSRTAYRSYRAGLADTSLVPGRSLPAVAAVLAGCEAAVALSALAALVLGAAGVSGSEACASALSAAAALTLVLALGVLAVLRRGRPARCACFGSSVARPLGTIHLIRNTTILAAIVAGLAADLLSPARSSGAGTAIAIVAGVVLGAFTVRLDDLAELFTPIEAAKAADGSASRHLASR
jgi:hypothetical protein